MGEQVQAYLKTVQEQIRWKRARPVLALELERHLADQTEAFQAEGQDEDTAVRLALEDMGDPVELGAELDRVHRPRPQWGLLGLTILMSCAGAFLRLFLTNGWVSKWESAPIRTTLALGLGIVCLLGAYFLDISRLARYAGRIYLAVLIIGYSFFAADVILGMSLFDSQSFSHGVPYYLVLLFPIVHAFWVYWCRGKGWMGFTLSWAGIFPLAILSAWWSVSVTNGIVLMAAGIVVILYAAWQSWFGLRRWQGFSAALVITIGFVILNVWWVLHHTSRFLYVVQPKLDHGVVGYFGLRLREFLQNISLVQSSGTGIKTTNYSGFVIGLDEELGRDFFPVILAARWGWLSFGTLLAVTTALVLWLLVRGLRQTHRLGKLIVFVTSLSLGFRALLSVAMNFGLLFLSTGFPFLGGNAFMVMDMTLTGLALSVFRGDSIAREEFTPPPRRIRRIRLMVEYR